MKKLIASLAGIAVCFGATAASAQLSNPLIVNVNCNTGGVIQTEIENATLSRPLEIVISGTCNQDVIIERDQVVLRSSVPGTRRTINGFIEVNTADRIELKDLLIRRRAGPAATGIKVLNGATVKMENVNVAAHRINQLQVSRNSAAIVEGSQFIGNAASQEAVIASDGGHIRMENSLIRAVKVNDSDGHGLGLYRNAVARLSRNTRLEHTGTGCNASNDFECAATIVGDGSQLRLQDIGPANTVTGNAVAFDRGQIDARATTFTGNLNANTMSYIELRDTTTVNGNVIVARRSLIRYKGASQTGTLNCFGESAVNGVPGTVTVPGSCTVL